MAGTLHRARARGSGDQRRRTGDVARGGLCLAGGRVCSALGRVASACELAQQLVQLAQVGGRVLGLHRHLLSSSAVRGPGRQDRAGLPGTSSALKPTRHRRLQHALQGCLSKRVPSGLRPGPLRTPHQRPTWRCPQCRPCQTWPVHQISSGLSGTQSLCGLGHSQQPGRHAKALAAWQHQHWQCQGSLQSSAAELASPHRGTGACGCTPGQPPSLQRPWQSRQRR